MKKAYLAISYSKRKGFDKEVECLRQLLLQKDIELIVFVDNYNFKANEEKEMMKTAFKEIDCADLFIAELSTKAIGVGIETGYAFAQEKPIIYLRKKGAEHSTTVAGCSTCIIEYENPADLKESMEKVLVELG